MTTLLVCPHYQVKGDVMQLSEQLAEFVRASCTAVWLESHELQFLKSPAAESFGTEV